MVYVTFSGGPVPTNELILGVFNGVPVLPISVLGVLVGAPVPPSSVFDVFDDVFVPPSISALAILLGCSGPVPPSVSQILLGCDVLYRPVSQILLGCDVLYRPNLALAILLECVSPVPPFGLTNLAWTRCVVPTQSGLTNLAWTRCVVPTSTYFQLDSDTKNDDATLRGSSEIASLSAIKILSFPRECDKYACCRDSLSVLEF